MGDLSKLRNWRLLALALGLALFVAFLAAGRAGEFGDERNDTLGYEQHYSCLAKGGSVSDCNTLISANPTEYIYPLFVALIAKTAGPGGFYWFKFVFALVLSFAVFLSCGLLSKAPALTSALLLLDFRFWEYVANSLRNGMAAAVFVSLFAFYALRGKTMPRLAALLAGTAHSSALVLLLVPRGKLGLKALLAIAVVCAVAIGGVDLWLPLLSDGALSGDKLAYYAMLAKDDDTAGFAVPAHYILAYAVMGYCYIRSCDRVFIDLCNVLLLLLVAALLLSFINLAYRPISLMLPFVAVGVTYPLEQLCLRLEGFGSGNPSLQAHARGMASAAFGVTWLLVLAAFVFALVRNFDAVRLHLA